MKKTSKKFDQKIKTLQIVIGKTGLLKGKF